MKRLALLVIVSLVVVLFASCSNTQNASAPSSIQEVSQEPIEESVAPTNDNLGIYASKFQGDKFVFDASDFIEQKVSESNIVSLEYNINRYTIFTQIEELKGEERANAIFYALETLEYNITGENISGVTNHAKWFSIPDPYKNTEFDIAATYDKEMFEAANIEINNAEFHFTLDLSQLPPDNSIAEVQAEDTKDFDFQELIEWTFPKSFITAVSDDIDLNLNDFTIEHDVFINDTLINAYYYHNSNSNISFAAYSLKVESANPEYQRDYTAICNVSNISESDNKLSTLEEATCTLYKESLTEQQIKDIIEKSIPNLAEYQVSQFKQ